MENLLKVNTNANKFSKKNDNSIIHFNQKLRIIL